LTNKGILASTQDQGGWRKSSYSNSAGGSCVEVKHDLYTIFVRDSKDRRIGQPIIGLRIEGWHSFIDSITGGAAIAEQQT
jgi:hypothetical protein